MLFLGSIVRPGGMSRARGAQIALALFLLLPAALLPVRQALAQAPQNSMVNGGFETHVGSSESSWSAYGSGYAVDTSTFHSGTTSLRCSSGSLTAVTGATQNILLNQTAPASVVIGAWSRAQAVSGTLGSDYSLYVNIYYTDGTSAYGNIVGFDTGTHDWQYKSLVISPSKSITTLVVYTLFRKHTGTVWFDDVSAAPLPKNQVFDSQTLAPPQLPAGQGWAWFARDDAAKSPIAMFKGGDGSIGLGQAQLGLTLTNSATSPDGHVFSVKVADTRRQNRAVTVYYVEKFTAAHPVWGNDIRNSLPVGSGDSAYLKTSLLGATGKVSIYPFGCVTGDGAGHAVGVPPTLGPRVVRVGYNSDSQLLYVAFDLMLTGSNLLNSDGAGHGSATVAAVRYDVDPAWGFRSAASVYYSLFPSVYTRRAGGEGIWLPFVDPATITGVSDFHVAYHEGVNSLAGDHGAGLTAFNYAGDMPNYNQPLPVGTPLTYTAALAQLHQDALGADPLASSWAKATLNSGSANQAGQFNLLFGTQAWNTGAVWLLNPSPNLPVTPDQPTKASLTYTHARADQTYAPQLTQTPDGEYLDSVEADADVLDFSPRSLQYSQTPPAFTNATLQPVLPLAYPIYDLANQMSQDLRPRGKLLMGNELLSHTYALAPAFDVFGKEVAWLQNGAWNPDTDATFNFRRTLSGQRPYLLIMDADFDALAPYVEPYFQRCLFYGMYPSMFSADGAAAQYFQNPAWYNRDRPLFRKYLPIIQALSGAGWQPVTLARASDPAVSVERYGSGYLTVMNSGSGPSRGSLSVALSSLGLSGSGSVSVTDLISGSSLGSFPASSSVSVPLTLAPQQVMALKITHSL